MLLTLEDPKARVGSGGASVNALLVVAEHLSAKAGYEVKYAINDRYFLELSLFAGCSGGLLLCKKVNDACRKI